jgi:hypothetical protein
VVEFYNPVHDMALPLVRAALAGKRLPVLEVPQIYQKTGPVEAFELQRLPESLCSQSICVELTQEELDLKIATIESGIYKMLFDELGTAILNAIPSHARREYFLKGGNFLPSPPPEQVLRYETRGRALKRAGAVRKAITFEGHYVQIFTALRDANLAFH